MDFAPAEKALQEVVDYLHKRLKGTPAERSWTLFITASEYAFSDKNKSPKIKISIHHGNSEAKVDDCPHIGPTIIEFLRRVDWHGEQKMLALRDAGELVALENKKAEDDQPF